MLAVVLATVGLAVAVPARIFLAQRHEIRQLQVQTRAQERHVAALRAERARWQDPGYVEAQAAARLHLALPGQTNYVVLGVPPSSAMTHAPASVHVEPAGTWYGQLWRSVTLAAATPRRAPTR